MKTLLIALWFASMVELVTAEPITVSRDAGDYRATITLSESIPRTIASISIHHRKEHYTLPASLFNDLYNPRIGPGFKDAEFTFKVEKSKASIGVSAGKEHAADDHI